MTLRTAVCLLSATLAFAEAPADIFPPPPPTGVSVARTFTTVTVRWPAVPRVSSYTVECQIKRYFLFSSTRRVEHISSTSFTMRFPYGASLYRFKVFAAAGPVVSSPSEEVSITSPLLGGQELQYLRA